MYAHAKFQAIRCIRFLWVNYRVSKSSSHVLIQGSLYFALIFSTKQLGSHNRRWEVTIFDQLHDQFFHPTENYMLVVPCSTSYGTLDDDGDNSDDDEALLLLNPCEHRIAMNFV